MRTWRPDQVAGVFVPFFIWAEHVDTDEGSVFKMTAVGKRKLEDGEIATSSSSTTCLAKCHLTQEMLSLNKFTGGHWASKDKHWRHTRDVWLPLLRSTQGLGVPIDHAGIKRRVLVERWLGKGQRRWDVQNMAGGSAKCVLDALVRLGWLKDDSPDYVELELRQSHLNDLNRSERAVWEQGIRTVVEIHEIPRG